jgi:hypothetical protein
MMSIGSALRSCPANSVVTEAEEYAATLAEWCR